jgi:hypothetical protein
MRLILSQDRDNPLRGSFLQLLHEAAGALCRFGLDQLGESALASEPSRPAESPSPAEIAVEPQRSRSGSGDYQRASCDDRCWK